MTGSWRDMLDPERGGRPAEPAGPGRAEPEDDPLALDLSVYRPWVLQRGRTRPPLMLDLRRYEPRSGLWTGWGMAYPSLVALEYTGDRLLSLDFGVRQFVIEGRGLDGLGRRLQEGSVISVQEYAAHLWPIQPKDVVVTSIRQIDRSI
jgi:hypothetical protein